MDLKLEKRFSELINLHPEAKVFYAGRVHSRKLAREASEIIGEPVVLWLQSRNLAYVLGYDEPHGLPDEPDDEPYLDICGVSGKEFKDKILPLIPRNAHVYLPDLGIKARGKYKGAYKVSGLKTAFEKLGKAGKMDYTKERFKEALKRV